MKELNINTMELNIITAVERRKVKIDGEMCELKNIDEFDLKDYLWMISTGNKFTDFSAEKLTTKTVNSLQKDVNTLIDKILIASDAIKKKLSFHHKRQIMTFFLNGLQTGKNTENTKSSPDSSDSTEETQDTGSSVRSG